MLKYKLYTGRQKVHFGPWNFGCEWPTLFMAHALQKWHIINKSMNLTGSSLTWGQTWPSSSPPWGHKCSV